MKLHKTISRSRLLALWSFMASLCLMISRPVEAQAIADQKTFASPMEAVNTLVEAARSGDPAHLAPLLGPQATELISSGDLGAAKQVLARFVKAYGEKHSLSSEAQGYEFLQVGPQDWPFPFPIVRDGKSWYFDIDRGNEEIVDRRIGRNEYGAIGVCEGYVQSQIEYASKSRDGNPKGVYAQKFNSQEGHHDGLYWVSKTGVDSPMGALVGKAAPEELKNESPAPYYGYLYKILTGDGEAAPGGAKSYLVDGKMTGGFAMIAYPAEYGVSGVMTFIVNRDGLVYERDLGEKTTELASQTTTFNPDSSWGSASDE
jgi:Protein of unknown function (DUF2950)